MYSTWMYDFILAIAIAVAIAVAVAIAMATATWIWIEWKVTFGSCSTHFRHTSMFRFTIDSRKKYHICQSLSAVNTPPRYMYMNAQIVKSACSFFTLFIFIFFQFSSIFYFPYISQSSIISVLQNTRYLPIYYWSVIHFY